MKIRMTKIFLVFLTLSVLANAFGGSIAAAEKITFSDVSRDYWGYETIMAMTEAGIFKGTTEPVNGVGKFSPEKEMTRAEFITAAMRAMYPAQAKEIKNDTHTWWTGYYFFAMEKGILKYHELDSGKLDQVITREEMAMIMVRCVEKSGEKLTQRVKTTRIPDYAQIGDYYKSYVVDCFSYGLLCGVDAEGTFLPDASLKRADAATVLCRLIDQEMRVKVDFSDPPTGGSSGTPSGSGNSGTTTPGGSSLNPNVGGTVIPSSPGLSQQSKLPWEVWGAKQPSQYTWAEFLVLSSAYKEAFIASFGSLDAFNAWMKQAQGGQSSKKLPWELIGAKQPSQYTLAEYEALSATVKEAFIASFGTVDAFNNWLKKAQEAQNAEKLPWEVAGAKQPSQYTWTEFEALSAAHKEAFIATFGGGDAFNVWMKQAQATPETDKFPWQVEGAKQPSQYTWAEFEELPATIQEAFIATFGSAEAFNTWKKNAQEAESSQKMPWEIPGAKQPSQYTYAEFNALTGDQQMAFQNSFGSVEAFDVWLQQAQGGGSAAGKMPWEVPGAKQPSQYTYAEFNALTGDQQMAFQNSFGSVEAFNLWLENAQSGGSTVRYPWELPGAKQPSQYTYAEFNALTGDQQMAFQRSFGSIEAFDVWLQNAQSGGAAAYPWEVPGAKQPSQYTYAEFNALTGEQQMAFQNSFGSFEAFDAWLQNAQSGGAAAYPWEVPGAKQPSQYTYAEFNALTGEQQMAFQNSFGSFEAFDAWLQNAQSGGTAAHPWEVPGAKQPDQYTYAEFEALTGEQQMAFQNSFGSFEAFDAWLQRVLP